MNDSIVELTQLITENLQSINKLKNALEMREVEKHDQLKEVSLGIIDVLDSFERIDANLTEKEAEKNYELNKSLARYKIVQKKLANLLSRFGITKIEFPDNRLIVGLCEVVDTVADSSQKNDCVTSVVRSGYIRGKELIRAAQVIVVKNG